MKKIVLLIIVLLGCIHVQANPIIYRPALLTELYFDANDNWTIEIKLLDLNYDLSYYRLKTSNGTSAIKSGIKIPSNNIILITKDSLLTPFSLSRDGGTVCLEMWWNSSWYSCPPMLSYGNASNPDVSTPCINQSIQLATCDPTNEPWYMYEKNNKENLGFFGLNFDYSSKIQGNIFDANLNRVPGNLLNTVISPPSCSAIGGFGVKSDGTFSTILYPRNYELKISDKNGKILKDTILSLEPDSTYNQNLYLDITLSSEGFASKGKEIKMVNYPNPFSDNTEINIEIPETYSFKTGIVKIYNSEGEIMSIKPLGSASKSTGNYHLKIDNSVLNTKSGNYFCVLELDGQKVASCQMTVVK